MPKTKRKKAIPIAPLPMQSRKKARIVTTAFHKHTRLLSEALQENDTEKAKFHEVEIEKLGGRNAYQAASVLSVKYFSTSKWVLSVLRKRGHLKIKSASDNIVEEAFRILEVGAINTEMLEAAKRSSSDPNKTTISMRAIDIQSQHPDIEELDFFALPEKKDTQYDAIVCSMVLNCVPSPEQRGDMLYKLQKHLNSDGLLFLTIPVTCMTLSKYMDRERFRSLLLFMGYNIVEEKESPKVAFFVLKSTLGEQCQLQKKKNKFQELLTIRRGKKFRNKFGIVLSQI